MEATSTKAKIGKSTYQTEYLKQPLNPKVTPWQTLDKKNKPAGAIGTTGSSTHKADFVRYDPRAGLKVDLGVQISSKPYKQGGVGGQFLSWPGFSKYTYHKPCKAAQRALYWFAPAMHLSTLGWIPANTSRSRFCSCTPMSSAQ